MIGVCGGIAYAKGAGLDADTVLKSIGGGAASGFQRNVLCARIFKGDVAPRLFMEHFIKDRGIALAEAARMGLELPGLAQAKKLYDQLMAEGHDSSGTQALYKYCEK